MDPSLYLRSDLLSRAGFAHAFFTRQGGVSSGAFGSLNLSRDVGDRPENVAENWHRVARVLGLEEAHVFIPRQVHERGVVVVDGRASSAEIALTPADAVISNGPGLACAVRTADCVPILVGDRQTRRVAAIHAGWRGVVQGVTRAAVEALLERGSRPEELIAAIGPHISLAAFEVGDEVARELAGASSAQHVVTRHEGQKAHVSLAGIVRAQLMQLGVPNDHVEELPGCTFGDASKFFSYRRDGRQSGRQVSAIVSERII
jgi:YfiH family protein